MYQTIGMQGLDRGGRPDRTFDIHPVQPRAFYDQNRAHTLAAREGRVRHSFAERCGRGPALNERAERRVYLGAVRPEGLREGAFVHVTSVANIPTYAGCS